jgi:hypothetical protein
MKAAGVIPEITSARTMSRLVNPRLLSVAGSVDLLSNRLPFRCTTMNRQSLHLAQLHHLRQNSTSVLILAAAAASLGTLFEAPAALAQPIKDGLGYRFEFETNSGPVAPAAPEKGSSWLTAVIQPIAGGVTIELKSNLSDPKEFISSVGFNLLDGDYGEITMSCSSRDIACGKSELLQADPDKQPPQLNFSNGIKGLDIGFKLPNAASSDRFQLKDSVIFTLLGDGSELLRPESFLTTISETGLLSTIFSAARVQGIQSGPGSTTISDGGGIEAVPGPLPLLGLAVALGYSRRLRRRLSKTQGLA